jgi:hypothetical protein
MERSAYSQLLTWGSDTLARRGERFVAGSRAGPAQSVGDDQATIERVIEAVALARAS